MPLQFLNNVIIFKTKALLRQGKAISTEFGYSCSQKLAWLYNLLNEHYEDYSRNVANVKLDIYVFIWKKY